MSRTPVRIVYFSSATENTRRFVDKLPYPNQRIPLRGSDPNITPEGPYVLVCPSYGGGKENKAVPPQVKKFLNVKDNREQCIGVIGSGNLNFGTDYLIATRILSAKLQVPFLYGFELMGVPEDVDKVREGLDMFFAQYDERKQGEKDV